MGADTDEPDGLVIHNASNGSFLFPAISGSGRAAIMDDHSDGGELVDACPSLSDLFPKM